MEENVHEYRASGASNCGLDSLRLMIVDDIWVSVGSVNIDDRSFRINDEANLNVLDRQFAATQIATFEDDKSKSRRILASDLEEQSGASKCKEWLASAFRWQL